MQDYTETTIIKSEPNVEYDFSVVMPFQSNDWDRYRIYQWIKKRWDICFPGIQILETLSEPFSRSVWRNQLADMSSSDILVFADADTIPDVRFVNQSVINAASKGWSIAYDVGKYYNLSEDYTEDVLAAPTNMLLSEPIYGQYDHKITSWSGMFAVMKEDFNKVRYDERFTGWGHEDTAWYVKACALIGQPIRVNGYVCHLWHSRENADFNTPEELQNRKLFEREYKRKYNWRDPR